MKNAQDARNDFWLDLGPVAEWADMDAENAAKAGGDASPDGKLRGFSGAEQGTVYEPSSNPDCGCGKKDGCGCAHPDGPDHNQMPDVNTNTVPPEVPPVPPETWPGL